KWLRPNTVPIHRVTAHCVADDQLPQILDDQRTTWARILRPFLRLKICSTNYDTIASQISNLITLLDAASRMNKYWMIFASASSRTFGTTPRLAAEEFA